jgi:hypothetical protein
MSDFGQGRNRPPAAPKAAEDPKQTLSLKGMQEERAAAVEQIQRTLKVWRSVSASPPPQVQRKAEEPEAKPAEEKSDAKAESKDEPEAQGESKEEKAEVSDPDEPAEKEADEVADGVADELAEEGEGKEAEGEEAEKKEAKGEKKKKSEDDPKQAKPDEPDEKKKKPIAAKLEGVGRKIMREPDPNAAQQEPELAPPGSLDEQLATIDAKLAKLKEAPPADAAQKEGAEGGGQMEVPDTGGIDTKIAMTSFVEHARRVQAEWSSLPPSERMGELGRCANQELALVGVFPCRLDLQSLGDDAGKFIPNEWQLLFNRATFEKPTIDKTEAAEIADTVYHEARHAEQFFQVARLMAGKMKPAEIAAKTAIPIQIATEAHKQPLTAGTPEAALAESVQQSVYGQDRPHREATLTKLKEATTEVKAAEAAVKGTAQGTEEHSQAIRRFEAAKSNYRRAMRDYKALPEEQDAFRVGGKLKDLYLTL